MTDRHTDPTRIDVRDALAIHVRLLAPDFVAPQEFATVAVLDLAAGRTGLDGCERFLRDHVRAAPS